MIDERDASEVVETERYELFETPNYNFRLYRSPQSRTSPTGATRAGRIRTRRS